MTLEEKKEFLCEYKNICEKILELEEQKIAVRIDAEQAKGQRLSLTPKGRGIKRDLSDVMVMLETLEELIDQYIIKSIKKKTQIAKMIVSISDAEESKVLRLRYIEFKQWDDIGDEIGCSRMTACRIHGRALEHLKIITEK